MVPDLFSRALGKDAWIFELITITSDGGSSWNIQFHRAPDDWEVERVDAFYEYIYSKMPKGEGVDSLFWNLTPNGVLDMRSFYNSLSTPPTIPFPWKCIWSVKVPRRISAQDSILTIDNLVKENLPLVNRCCLCRYDGETMDHLLLHCKFAHALWSEVFFYVWYTMGDAKDGCFSSLCMGELFGDTLFFGLEYGASLFDVTNLEGTKYPYF